MNTPNPDSELTPADGPRFFAERVKDDPEPTLLYDPQLDRSARSNVNLDIEEDDRAPQGAADSAPLIPAQEGGAQAQPQPKKEPTVTGQNLPGLRSQVTAEPLPSLGGIVIGANNQQDIEAAIAIIKWLQDNIVPKTEIEIRFVRLKQGDATSIVSILNQLYQRVQLGASGIAGLTAPTTTTAQVGFFQAQTSTQQAASVALLPVARFNGIFVATSKARIEEVIKQIQELDVPSPGAPAYIPLKKAGAQRIAQLLQTWVAQRYPNETNQIRISFDTSSNSVIVQAAPADLADIRAMVERLDTAMSQSWNSMRILHLQNALSDDMARILGETLSQGVLTPTVPTTTFTQTPGGGGFAGGFAGGGFAGGGFAGGGFAGGGIGGGGFAGGGIGGGLGGGIGGAGGGLGGGGFAGAQPGGFGGAGALGGAGGGILGAAGGAARTTTTGIYGTFTTRSGGVRLQTATGPVFESGPLEDVFVISEPRTNSLILMASEKTMDMLIALAHELDVLPQVLADVKVFQLKRADATQTANILQQLLLGTAARTTAAGGTPTLPGALGTAATAAGQIAGAPGAVAGAGAVSGAAGLHISVDERTNSILVAGNPQDVFAIGVIISRFDDADIQQRRNEVYQLHNAQAADVATELATFFSSNLTVLSNGAQLTNFQEIQRQIVVVPDPVTNQLLISTTPQYYPEVVRLIEKLDTPQPQVVISVLMADVVLDASEEFGVEIGLQSPVLFSRGTIPLQNLIGTGSITYATPTTGTGLVPPGVTVNSSINPTALPSYNFNTQAPLGTNPAANPGIVGFQGLGNLGLGRVSPNSGVGGFVFSAASDSFSLLLRALKTQGRLDILSRPSLMTFNNQTANLLVGQNFPVVTATNVTATGLVTNSITYVDVGVSLAVTPQITVDNRVLMRVQPTVSSVANTTVSLGNGVTATAFNTQQIATTVIADDGETVAIGGLIMKRDNKTENKIPWLGDLPCVGVLFRTRFQQKHKEELLVILTPHVIRTRLDADRMLADESRRMDWVIGDVLKIQGTRGMAPIMPQPVPTMGDFPMPPSATPHLPGGEELPLPTPLPPAPEKPAAGLPPPPATIQAAANVGTLAGTLPPPVAPTSTAPPTDQGKESARWNWLRRK